MWPDFLGPLPVLMFYSENLIKINRLCTEEKYKALTTENCK